jgi:hypothetical protein
MTSEEQKKKNLPTDKISSVWKYKKIPKIAFTYWAGPMSKLHYLSIRSAVILNPDWEIILYQPKIEYSGEKTWSTPEHSIKYSGKDYRQYLSKIDRLKIINIDFQEIGFRNDVPEIFKSGYMTHYHLSKQGGVWFDTDVLFVRPLNELDLTGKIVKGNLESIDVAVSYNSRGYFSMGVIMGKPNNEFYSLVLETLLKRYDPKIYMSSTNYLYPHLFKDINGIHTVFPTLQYANLEMDIFYPYQWNHMNILFQSNKGMERITNKVIGIHWYNGSLITETFLNKQDYDSDILINQIIKKFNLSVDL